MIQRQAMELVPAEMSALASAKSGYYELPMLKEPSWTWEIPLYFFVGGAAGASGVIGAIARLSGASPSLVRDARRIAFVGRYCRQCCSFPIRETSAVSCDASCFQAAESNVGRSLGFGLGFSGGATAANVGDWLEEHSSYAGLARLMQTAGDIVALLFGLPLATYTGVLIGATVIPRGTEYRFVAGAFCGIRD